MLEVRSLTKYYEHTAAVRGVSFAIKPGEILGLLGPNGAGKSTTVKMLTGLIDPSEGQILYQGRSVREDFTAFQRRIGYVPEEAHLYPHLSGYEYLQLVGRLRGLQRDILEPKMDEFLRLFGLWDDRHAALSSYSKGMRQKVLLAAALLHEPEILILDEPFSGLDVTSAMMLRSLLRALAAEGKIILYSSHVLEVVEKVCSNVVILRKGEMVAYDSIDRLRELMSQPSLEGVFAQLAQVDQGEEVASRIVEAMRYGKRAERFVDRPVEIGLRMYRALANAFPHEFRNVYGEEMLQAGEDVVEPVWRRHGWRGLAGLLADAAIRIPIEYIAEISQDLRYALRALARSPGFTAVALLSLSLGICIATCAFSEMNGLVLRLLPRVTRPSELVALQLPVSYPDYRRYQNQGDLFSSSFAYVAPVPFAVSFGGHAERIWGSLVAASYFSSLGVKPEIGSLFAKDQNAPDVIVSDRFWREHLGADPAAVGKPLRINAQSFTIVGVGPKDFFGVSPMLFPADLWLPVSAGRRITPELAGDALERRDRTMFRVVGRLNAGVSFARAEAQLDSVARQLEQDAGDHDRNRKDRRITLVEGGRLFPLRKQDMPFFTSFLTVMAGLILLIAGANVGNMMLARALGRRREIAVRLSLGASRVRLIRQLLVESTLLSAAAAVPGFLLSVWLMHLGSQVRMPLPIPVAFDFSPDARVLLITIGISVLTGIAFGLAPALQATKADIAPALKEGSNVQLGGRRRISLRGVLMASQVAASLTLLVIVGSLSLGIQTTLGIQSGFHPQNLSLISLDPVRSGYSGEQAAAFFDRLLKRVRALRGITSATVTESVPVSMAGPRIRVLGGCSGPLTIGATKHTVGAGYFETAEIAVLRGRAFRQQDENAKPRAIAVSQELMRELCGNQDIVGRLVEIENGDKIAAKILPGTYDYRAASKERESFQIVGVVGDVAEGLVVQKPRPAVYFPLRDADYATPPPEGMTLIVRSAPGMDAIATVRREIGALDSSIPVFNARTMPEQIDQFMAPLRMAAWTYAVIGIFGLALASVGLAGVTAYSVTERRQEIGIRMALGARRGNVLQLVMRQGLAMVAAGTAVGMAGAWSGTRLLAAMNSGVGQVTTSTSEPQLVLGAPLLLAALALIACYIPARQSMRIDPAVALRQE